MSQAIPAYVINLTRRPDRLERIAAHLADRNVDFTAIAACDATEAPAAQLDAVITPGGPLGQLGIGDRACTVSHTWAWAAFLRGGAEYGLFLEDDVWLSADTAASLIRDDWIPPGAGPIKLEKFGKGASHLLLGQAQGQTPTGRALHPLLSRHVGGGAYILSRAQAEAALAMQGRMRVPVDHFLFNGNVSRFSRRMRPVMTVPAMATQRVWDYNSDIAKHGKAARPDGLALKWRRLKRGYFEINRAPPQLWAWATRTARVTAVSFEETPPGEPPGEGPSETPDQASSQAATKA